MISTGELSCFAVPEPFQDLAPSLTGKKLEKKQTREFEQIVQHLYLLGPNHCRPASTGHI